MPEIEDDDELKNYRFSDAARGKDGDDDDRDDPDHRDIDRDDMDTIPCPHCRKLIYPESFRCPYCKSLLTADEQAGTHKKPLWVIITVIICVLLMGWWMIAAVIIWALNWWRS